IDRSARSAYEVARWKALGLGITERAPEWPMEARKASNRRNLALSSSGRPFDRPVRGDTGRAGRAAEPSTSSTMSSDSGEK
ncbi:hypothetical protein THAOC_23787, partial [Thalassiosira oceanica]